MITKHGIFNAGVIVIVFFFVFFYDNLTFPPFSTFLLFPLEPKRKPSRFFIEQWKVSHGLSQSPASPLCSPESPRQVWRLVRWTNTSLPGFFLENVKTRA